MKILISLILLSFNLSCLAQNENNIKHKQYNFEKIHIYGSKELKRIKGSDEYATLFIEDSTEFQIREVYPGILLFSEANVENRIANNIKIEFYDIYSKKLIREINLKEVSPYNNKLYPNIEIGTNDYEWLSQPSPIDTSCNFPTFPKPNRYRTYTYVHEISGGGFICVSFWLMKIANLNDIVGWEQTFFVFSPSGKETYRDKTNYLIRSPQITINGNYLVYVYGNDNNENPFEPCKGAFKIFDLKTNKLFCEKIGDMNEIISDPVLIEDEIHIRFSNSKTHQYKQLIVNTKGSEIKIYEFKSENFFFKNYVDYLSFLETQPFSTQKIKS